MYLVITIFVMSITGSEIYLKLKTKTRWPEGKWRDTFPRGPVIGLPLCLCTSPKSVEDDWWT